MSLWAIQLRKGLYSVTERADGREAIDKALADGAVFVTGSATPERAEHIRAKLQKTKPLK